MGTPVDFLCIVNWFFRVVYKIKILDFPCYFFVCIHIKKKLNGVPLIFLISLIVNLFCSLYLKVIMLKLYELYIDFIMLKLNSVIYIFKNSIYLGTALHFTRCQLSFISCLDSHSDGTHSLQWFHWWAIDAMLISPNLFWWTNSTSWMNWGWLCFQHIFIFERIIPLRFS